MGRARTALAGAALTCALLAGCGDEEQGAREGGGTAGEPPAATVPATSATTAPPRECGQVGFQPNTDAGAFRITAEGVDCETARAVAAAAEDASGLSFTARGFRCAGERQEGALPSVAFTCTRDGATIRFDRS